MELVRFLCEFMSSNPFVVCSEELGYVKKQLLRDGDELKVKQKAGTLRYVARQGKYVLMFVLANTNGRFLMENIFAVKMAYNNSTIDHACCAVNNVCIHGDPLPGNNHCGVPGSIHAGILLTSCYQCHMSIQ